MNNATKNYIGKNKNTRRKETETIAPRIRGIFAMDEAKKRCIGNTKRPKKICSDKSIANGFLKTTFLPKLNENDFQKSIHNSNQSVEENFKTEKNFYKSLSKIAEHYQIKLMPTKDFEFPYNLVLSLFDAENQLKNNIENWESFRVMQDENNTYFISKEQYHTRTNLFYIPVVPLYKMLKNKKSKKSAQLLLSVCSYFYRNANIPYYRQDNSYLYWNYEILKDWIEEDGEIDENHSSKKELQQAEIIGDIMEQKILHSKNLEFFRKRIECFKPNNNFDKNCFLLAKKTFQIYEDYPEESIFRNLHYNNILLQENSDVEFYNEETVISMDKYISFFADDKGLIYQNLIDCVNNEFNEYGEVQEPIVFKTFDGSDLTNNNLDFEIRLFEVLTQLTMLLNFQFQSGEEN